MNRNNEIKDKENEYSINELLECLLHDDSWEKDEQYRRKAIQMLRKKMPGCMAGKQ